MDGGQNTFDIWIHRNFRYLDLSKIPVENSILGCIETFDTIFNTNIRIENAVRLYRLLRCSISPKKKKSPSTKVHFAPNISDYGITALRRGPLRAVSDYGNWSVGRRNYVPYTKSNISIGIPCVFSVGHLRGLL